MQAQLVSLKKACEMTSMSRTMINILRKQDRFPAAVELGAKRIGFLRSEVDQWIADRVAARDAKVSAKRAELQKALAKLDGETESGPLA